MNFYSLIRLISPNWPSRVWNSHNQLSPFHPVTSVVICIILTYSENLTTDNTVIFAFNSHKYFKTLRGEKEYNTLCSYLSFPLVFLPYEMPHFAWCHFSVSCFFCHFFLSKSANNGYPTFPTSKSIFILHLFLKANFTWRIVHQRFFSFRML